MAGNIYHSKHYKLYILIPVALLLISLFFIPHIQLDSSLRGGISVQLQTNATPNIRNLTTAINSQIPGAEASVAMAPGGLSITMVDNQSLSNAQTDLLNLFAAYSNYTQLTLNLTTYQSDLTTNSSNATALGFVTAAKKGIPIAQAQMSQSYNAETTALVPILGTIPPTNMTNYAGLVNSGQNLYTNASAKYQSYVITKLSGLVNFSTYSYNEVTATLGSYFLGEIEGVMIAALILVAIAVFVIFRTPIPAFAVVFGAVTDIVVALGGMGLFGIPLGVASVGGLLMLLGFSIDTDMLSAVRILKRNDATPEIRAFSTFKTGITMTTTAIISFAVLFAVSYFAFIPTYSEIAAVVLIGLVTDLMTTWLCNTPIILWYKKRKDGVAR